MMNEAKSAQIKRLAEDVDTILDKLYDESLSYAVYRESVIFSDYYDPEFDDEKIRYTEGSTHDRRPSRHLESVGCPMRLQ